METVMPNKSKEQHSGVNHRRHTNNHGTTQVKSGASFRRLKRLCNKLFPGVPVRRGGHK